MAIPLLLGGAAAGFGIGAVGQLLFGGPKPGAPASNVPSGHSGRPATYSTTSKPKSTQSAYEKQRAKDQQRIAALEASAARQYVPPTPRIASYDLNGSYKKARDMATKAKSPEYKRRMNNFVAKQKVDLGRKKSDIKQDKASLDQALARILEDSGIMRARTVEDRDSNVADITATRAAEARVEGLDFDSAYRAMTEGLGASNMAESGLGQQQIGDAITARNTMSNEQVRQSENKIEAQNILLNRTFQDLMTSDTRNTQDTQGKKKRLDIDLERFIQDQAYEKKMFKQENEMARQAAIAQATANNQRKLVDQWIQGLSKQGYTAEEIAIAASIYR